MKLTEVFARRTYDKRSNHVSIDVDPMSIQRLGGWIRSMDMVMISDVDVREDYPSEWWEDGTMQNILTIRMKGWEYYDFYHGPKNLLLAFNRRERSWFKSKQRRSKPLFMTNVRRWWGSDEIKKDFTPAREL